MVDYEVFLIGLIAISTLTSLTTEAVKKILTEHSRTYRANTLAGVVAMILSVVVGAGYVILADVNFSLKTVVCIVALTFMSWLCAMVGYDKVIATFKPNKKD